MSAQLWKTFANLWGRVWQGDNRARRRLNLAAGRALDDEQKRSRAEARAHFWTQLREGEREAAARCAPDQ